MAGFAEDDHYLARMDHVFGNSAFDAVFVAPDVRSTLAWPVSYENVFTVSRSYTSPKSKLLLSTKIDHEA